MTRPPLQRGSRGPAPEVLDAISRAMRAHSAGNLGEAEALYNLVLTHDSRQFDALNMLGIVYAQRRNYEAAARTIERALKVNPHSAEAFANLGRVRFEMGDPQRAAESYARAIAIKPDFIMAHSNFAAVLRRLERPQEALAHCDIALAKRPDYVEALNNRGNALFDLARFEEAIASYDQALKVTPQMAEAWLGRGNTCFELGRRREAMIAYQRALAINPNSTESWTGMGNLLASLKRGDEALSAFQRALTLDPNSAIAWRALGYFAERARRFGEAFNAYDRARKINPSLKYIEGRWLHAKLHLCDWSRLDSDASHLVAEVNRDVPAAAPFMLLCIPSTPADQLRCARKYVADRNLPVPKPLPHGGRYRHDRINIAYLSADFRDHAVSFLLAGLFEKHDRSRFRTIAVSFGADRKSGMRARLVDAFETFLDVDDASYSEVVSLLREHEVDIAVDLMGFTHEFGASLLSERPAPIQISYLGFSGTMGADFVDYMIADRTIVPPNEKMHYAEKIVYLPDTFQANDDKRVIAAGTPSRAEAGLPEKGFVFCCFNQNFKIQPDVFGVWMRLLRDIEGSVVWIQAGDPIAAQNLRAAAVHRGVAGERIIIAPSVAAHEDHLARYRLADLFLDTLPYNAHTTASDALWAGVPVVTCVGSTFAGRVAASLLNAIGLPELITTSLADYEALALQLAREPARLAAVKAKLAEHRTAYPLFDTDRFRRHLEAAYVTMYERHQRGEPPVSFEVAPIDQP